MADIDAELRRAGEIWRDSTPLPLGDLQVRAATVERANSLRLAWRLVPVALAIAVAVPILFKVFEGQVAKPGGPLTATAVGSQVIASGRVVASSDNPVMLCRFTDAIDLRGGPGSAIQCSSPSVELQGLNVTTVPGAIVVGDTAVVNLLTVHGTWSGSAVRVESFEPSSAQAQEVLPPKLSCSALVPGEATPPTVTSLESEAEYARLQTEIESDPNLYAGEWVKPSNSGVTVVVGTTGDVGVVSNQLRLVFPYSLCVVAVPHSMSALKAALDAVTEQSVRGWVGELAVDRNVVVLRLPVVDTSVTEFTRSYPQVAVAPLVR